MTDPSLDPARLARFRRRNRLQAAGLLAVLAAVLVAIADLLAGGPGIAIALGIVVGAAVLAPRAAPELMLRVLRARPLDRWRHPAIYDRLDRVAIRAGLDRLPGLVVVPSVEPVAFSLSTRRGPVVGLSTGAIETLGLREMTAVLAHEVAHLASGDSAIMALSEIMGRLVRGFAVVGLALAAVLSITGGGDPIPAGTVAALVVAPFATLLLQTALARNREFDADQSAIELTGDPAALAVALRRIELEQAFLWRRLLPRRARVTPPGWLRTHPATEARIARLRAMTGGPGGDPAATD
ncbi:MAG: zinc metalloprotease HtpX [Azospirillaceae bacterium]